MGLIGPTTYNSDPNDRHPDAIINAKEPYNAEPPPHVITKSFLTPVPFFYKRSHGPIPILEGTDTYKIHIHGLLPTPVSLSLQDVKNLPKHSITATLQCAGNRRTEMSLTRAVRGVGWGLGALGNATWSGARLADVLALAGIPIGSSSTPDGGRHVEFISVDACKEENGGPYKASIPLTQATSIDADVLLAYEMNGQPLNRDHGFPLRVVAPGIIGARSVKWIVDIVVRSDECQGFFQQRDYKMFPPWIDWDNVDWTTRKPIMDFPVQSAICQPLNGDTIVSETETVIRGYALSGNGRRIERVDISVDGGKTWSEASRDPGSPDSKWVWTFWEFKTIISTSCEIVVRAVDEGSNVQPASVDQIWNLRGVLNNSWHRITVNAASDNRQLGQ